ncbi:MAG: YciI family protein [Ferruginibacter sp.]
MKEFLLVFRTSVDANQASPSPEQLQESMKEWQEWIGGIAAQNKLVSVGNRLSSEGKVMKPGNVITNGPFVEIKEAIGGYTMVKTDTLEDAAELAKRCPIFAMNGSVEIREVVPL